MMVKMGLSCYSLNAEILDRSRNLLELAAACAGAKKGAVYEPNNSMVDGDRSRNDDAILLVPCFDDSRVRQ